AQIAQDARATVRLTVRAKPVSFPAGAGDVQTTFFTVGLVKDAGGATVDSDGDGLPDVYPRAFLVKLDDNDPTGLTQFAPTTVIPAAVDPTPFLPALLANGAPAILPATKLSIIVRPAALDATNPAAPTRLPVMPAGKYKVVLMNATGQLWQIPNEAGPAALDPGSVCPSPTTCGAGQVSTASQSRSFAVVPPAGAVPPGAIAGTVKLVSGQQTTVKAVYVYAFSTNDPPPPLGTGKPVSADVHFGAEMAISGGDKTLSYTLKALPAGSYYVEAVIDTRGDYALDPFLFAAAPGPGSIAGAHLDASFHLAPITVAAAPVTGQDVTALASQQLPARPAFQLADASGTVATADLTGLVSTSASPMKFTLKSSTVLDASVSTIPEAANSASFLVQLICNGTATTDADYDNLPDVYPQVRLVKLDSSDPTGLTYDTSSGGLIAIPAAVDPTPFLGTGVLSCSSGSNVKLSTQLTVLVSPAAVKQVPGQQPQPLANIPAGRYGVVAIEGTGQVWRVPNELQPALIDPRTQALAPSTFMSLATQGLGFSVGAGATPPGGAIQGNLLLSGLSPAAVGNVLIAAYRASDPPPPSGTGRPVLATVIPRPFVALGVGAGRLQYALPGLPPDTYLVAAMHDADDRFNPILSYLATPGLGAQLAFAGGVPAPVVVTTTPVAAADIAIDGTATPSLPFERPMFTSDATAPAVMPAGQTTPYLVTLNSTAPSALPGGLLSGSNGVIQPRFHPHLVFVNGVPQKDSFGRFLVTTTVYVTPIDPGQYGVVAVVDPRSFCGQLVSGADSDCSTGTPIVSGGVPAVAEVQSLNLIVVPTLKADLIAKAPTAGRPPSGSYRMTVIEFTGQTWSVPNELATSGGADGLGQAATFVVQ
ncbi:MAG: hypothetical protein JST92_04955, partial [Deltaproteobacteria bacterium]|nr:hypothetical protein [Deltaproteobacteria bacterium]